MSLRRSVLIIGVASICIVACAGIYFWQQASGYRAAFETIKVGDSEVSVVQRMGTPARATDGTVSVYGGAKMSSELTAECVKELWYQSTLSPEQWAICLDSSGRVVDVFHYASY